METFESLGAAVDAIVQFDREKYSTLPEHTQAELTRLAGVGISPVDRVVRTAEALYAERSSLTRIKDKLLVAQLMNLAAQYGFHGVNEDGRAQRIELIMRKAAGEDVAEVPEADIPAPRADLLAPSSADPLPSGAQQA